MELLPETDQARDVDQGPYGHNAGSSEGVTQEQLRALTNSFRTAHLQGLRIASFAYEPFSLPASRVSAEPVSGQPMIWLERLSASIGCVKDAC